MRAAVTLSHGEHQGQRLANYTWILDGKLIEVAPDARGTEPSRTRPHDIVRRGWTCK